MRKEVMARVTLVVRWIPKKNARCGTRREFVRNRGTEVRIT